jgi:hypothetical protein
MIRRLITLAIVLSTVVVAVGGLRPAGAADNGEWGLLPISQSGEAPRANFVLDATPGSTVTDVAVLVNHTDKPLELALYPADAHNTASGGFALLAQDAPRVDVGAWVTLPVESEHITLDPTSELAIPFTVTVPADATPGDHAGGIVAIQPDATAVKKEAGANIGLRYGVGVRIYMRVAGPAAPQVAVTDVKIDLDRSVGTLFGFKSDGVVSYTIKNTGNLTLVADATVVVHGLGWEDKLQKATVADLLPGESAKLQQPFSGAWPTGRITANVDVRAFDQTASGSATTLAIPWLLLLVMLLLAMAIWYRRRRSRRVDPDPTDDSEVPAGDSGEPVGAGSRPRATVDG